MNITLTPKLKELIEQKVASGRYHSASEVVRDALRLMEEKDRDLETRLAGLRAEIAAGVEDFKQGRAYYLDENTLNDIKTAGRKRLAEAKKNA